MDSITEKLCRICGKTKPLKDFRKGHPSNLSKIGVYHKCRDCEDKYRKEYYQENKEVIRDRNIKYAKTSKVKAREYRYKSKYGITLEQYNYLLEKQSGKCATCGKKPNGKNLVVDHNHKNGEVRGLLCADCNFALGHVRDNPNILRKLADYLLKL